MKRIAGRLNKTFTPFRSHLNISATLTKIMNYKAGADRGSFREIFVVGLLSKVRTKRTALHPLSRLWVLEND